LHLATKRALVNKGLKGFFLHKHAYLQKSKGKKWFFTFGYNLETFSTKYNPKNEMYIISKRNVHFFRTAKVQKY
jgi:hypothetical protein